MEEMTIVAIIGAALLIGGLIVWAVMKKRRSAALRDRFGTEYDHTVHTVGSKSRAERELEMRQERVARLNIRSLDPDERERFSRRWMDVQAGFVDHPTIAVQEADELLADVTHARGYPVGNFEQRAADLSVDYPVFVDNYRAARAITVRRERGQATTEDLRQAMVHYRALFEHLIDAGYEEHIEPVATQSRIYTDRSL